MTYAAVGQTLRVVVLGYLETLLALLQAGLPFAKGLTKFSAAVLVARAGRCG